jgi:hypothetical protein
VCPARYADGHELEQLMVSARFCGRVLEGFGGSARRPLSRLAAPGRRALAGAAAAALRSRAGEGRAVMRVVRRGDRRK